MEAVDFAAFQERADEFENAVCRETEIATFCSGPVWQIAALRSLHGCGEESNFVILNETDTWLVFVEREEGIYFPLESAWMFGCPLIGDPDRAIEILWSVARNTLERPSGFMVSGVLKDGLMHRKLKDLEKTALRFEEFPATDCMTIDLSEGFDAWLVRRSRKFRKSIRQLKPPEGLEVVDARADDPDSLMDRILAVQQKTYKWREGMDIFQGENYVRFYRDILEQLHARGEARILFGQLDGQDMSYIFGGVSGTVYRGFQMSYVEELKEFGIGNYLQINNMKASAAEGITHYDLGMHAAYKERWADHRERYVGVWVVL